MSDFREFICESSKAEMLVTESNDSVQFDIEDPSQYPRDIITLTLNPRQINHLRGFLNQWQSKQLMRAAGYDTSCYDIPCTSKIEKEPERKTGTDWLYSTTEKDAAKEPDTGWIKTQRPEEVTAKDVRRKWWKKTKEE